MRRQSLIRKIVGSVLAIGAATLLAACGESQNPGSGGRAAVPPGTGVYSEKAQEAGSRAAPEPLRDITVTVRDVVTVPPSSKAPPLARINLLIPAGDNPGRLFVNDMNGKIFVIKDGMLLAEPLLDMTVARRKAFTSDVLF